MRPSHLKHCPSRDALVSLKDGYAQCIMDHQCFSDDPCPLKSAFDQAQAASAAGPVKPAQRPASPRPKAAARRA